MLNFHTVYSHTGFVDKNRMTTIGLMYAYKTAK